MIKPITVTLPPDLVEKFNSMAAKPNMSQVTSKAESNGHDNEGPTASTVTFVKNLKAKRAAKVAGTQTVDEPVHGKKVEPVAATLKAELDPEPKIEPVMEAKPEPEPSADGKTNETAKLLNDLGTYFKDYIVLPADFYYGVLAAWVLHAAAIQAFEITPRLTFRSPVKRSGKSRALSTVEMVLPNASSEINPKPASLIRSIDFNDGNEVILFDEVDQFFNPKAGTDVSDVLAVLNSGFERGREVSRYDVRTRTNEKLSVFCPCAFGSIDKLPDTQEDRSIVIPMQRKLPSEKVKRFLRHEVKDRTKTLRARIRAWADDNVSGLREARPTLPEDLDDRAADIWWPLFCVADQAGGKWPEAMRSAAMTIANARIDDDDSALIKLLRGIRLIWPPGTPALSNGRIVQLLNENEELSYGGWSDGEGITSRKLNAQLGKLGLKSGGISVAGEKQHGHRIENLDPLFERYLGVKAADPLPSGNQSATEPLLDSSSSSRYIEVLEGKARVDENTGSTPYPYESATPDPYGVLTEPSSDPWDEDEEDGS
jgi:hypothetical protein